MSRLIGRLPSRLTAHRHLYAWPVLRVRYSITLRDIAVSDSGVRGALIAGLEEG